MTATNKEMSTEFQYFGDVWTFFKKYYHVRPDDDYWEAVVEESSAIVQKYNNLPLCKDLVLAVIGELERKEKAMRGAEDVKQYRFSIEELKKLTKSLVILVDSREKKNDHILSYFTKQGIAYQETKLDYGDYSFSIQYFAREALKYPLCREQANSTAAGAAVWPISIIRDRRTGRNAGNHIGA